MNVSSSFLVLAMGLALAGCANSGPRPSSPIQNADETGGKAVWPFWPKSMRVHPISYLLPEGQQGTHQGTSPDDRLYELYLEFKDKDGIVCRALGNLEIYLYDATPAGGDEIIMPKWSWDLSDLTLNKEYFDDVMRTYLLSLRITVDPLPELMLLRVYYASANGVKLDAEAKITPRDGS